jgi:hypothetical protein
MRTRNALTVALVAVVAAWTVHGHAQDQKPTVQIPQPGVPQIMTIEGNFIRVAYNNEGYAILGYQLANRSVNEPWMLLEFGTTVREGVPDYRLKRADISLDTPDGKTVPLPSIEEYRQAASGLQGLQARSRVQRDSINYFPPMASDACRLGFFSDLDDRAMPWDEVELSYRRGCVGRLYFPVEGGIKYGQYFLNVKFAKSLVRVPFRIFTKEEERTVSRNYGDIKKQIDAAFRRKK